MYCIGKIVPCTVQVDCLILQAHSVQEKHQSVLELFLHYRYHTTALLALLCTTGYLMAKLQISYPHLGRVSSQFLLFRGFSLFTWVHYLLNIQ